MTDRHPVDMLDTGHGTGIDRSTLRGVIHDRGQFDEWLASGGDPAALVIGALYDGQLDDAERLIGEALVTADAGVRFRLRCLRADVARERGEYDAAAATYHALLDEHAGTAREAVLWQHLGKIHFVAGNYSASHDCFARSLDLRIDAGAPADQVASSTLALSRAAEELARCPGG